LANEDLVFVIVKIATIKVVVIEELLEPAMAGRKRINNLRQQGAVATADDMQRTLEEEAIPSVLALFGPRIGLQTLDSFIH